MNKSVKENEEEEKKPNIFLGEGVIAENFRKEALEQITSPDELNLVFWPVKAKLRWVWVVFFVLLSSSLLWVFFGSIPLTINGKGVIISEEGFFTIHAKKEGLLTDIYVQPGQNLIKDQPVFMLDDEVIKSPFTGNVLEVLIPPESNVNVTTPILRGEYTEKEPSYVIYALVPIEKGKEVKKGLKVEAEVSTAQASQYGALIGEVVDTSSYPISKAYLTSLLQNKELVNYLMPEEKSLILLTIRPEIDSSTPTGYRWTSGKGPLIPISSGIIVDIKGVVGYVQPIFYFFPVSHLYETVHKIEKKFN